MKYEKSSPGTALRQGELLSNVIELTIDLDTMFSQSPNFAQKTHPFAVIMSQDCDLDWDFAARNNQSREHKKIPNALLCEVMLASDLARVIVTQIDNVKDTRKSRTWTRVKQNKDERYHFFEKIDESEDLQNKGIQELGSDFKRYFTVPADELYKRILHGDTLRRCRLLSPYMEHLSSRFAYFQSRIALPEDHFSEPGVIRRDTDA